MLCVNCGNMTETKEAIDTVSVNGELLSVELKISVCPVCGSEIITQVHRG